MVKKRVKAIIDDFVEEQAILAEGVLLAPYPESGNEDLFTPPG